MKKLIVSLLGVLSFVTAASAQYSPSASGSTTAAGEINSKLAFQVAANPSVLAGLNGSAGKDFAFVQSPASLYICTITGSPCATWTQIESTMTFATGLSRSGSSVTCVTANGSTLGCISAADWATFNAKMNNPLTTAGDIVISAGGTAPGRLAAGAADTFLQGNGAGVAPSYGSLTNCGDSSHALAYSTSTHSFSCQAIAGGGGMADPGGNGILSRTALNTTAARTLTGTSNRLTVTNGDGVSGNPTFDVSSSYIGQASITTLGTVGTGVWQGTVVAPGFGGSGVANTVTHTLGTSPQNWATLGTGIVKNTTVTGAITNAAASDVVTLFTGTPNGAKFLRDDGTLATPAGSGTVTVVGSGALGSTAFATGGGLQALQTPSLTSTLDASGNANFAGAVAATSFSTGAGAPGTLSGAEQSRPTVTTPTLYFDSSDHVPDYLDASGALAALMVVPRASRVANQFCTHVDIHGVCQAAAIVGADLPLPSSSTLGGVKSHVSCGTGNHIDSIGTDGVPTCTADATTGGSVSVTTKGDLQGYNTGAARIPVGTNGQSLVADSTQALGVKWADKTVRSVKVLFDAGDGATLTAAASVRCGLVEFAGAIQSATIASNVADSAVVDVKTVAYGSYTGPASATSIAASAKPTLASALTSQDSTLTGWTKALAANTYVCFSMTGPTVAQWVEVALKVLPN